MTLFSRRLVGLLAVSAATVACRSQPVDQTSVEFVRQTTSTGDLLPCHSVSGGDPGMMDSYMVEVYEYNEGVDPFSADGGIGSASSTTIECQRCVASSDICHLERAPVCRCGPRQHVDPGQLQASLQGMRIEGIDANYAYCLRIIAIDSGTLPAPGDTPDADTDCMCDSEWTTPPFMAQFLSDSARLCSLSEPAAAGPAGFETYVTCPGDGVNFRFPSTNATPYQQCLFPTAN